MKVFAVETTIEESTALDGVFSSLAKAVGYVETIHKFSEYQTENGRCFKASGGRRIYIYEAEIDVPFCS